MNGSPVSRDVRCRLAAYIEDRRRELVASVVRAPVIPRLDARRSAEFANAFLDGLYRDLNDGIAAAVEWTEPSLGVGEPGGAAERARVVSIACSVIVAAYAAEYGQADDIVEYLSWRSRELEQRIRAQTEAASSVEIPKEVSRDQVVCSLLSAMEARDRATSDHSRAVGMWCNRIAKTIGLSVDDQALATLAGTLYDVGKIATPSEILLKPGPLDTAEWEAMRAHARIGAKMVERYASLAHLAPIVRGHHEWIDGSGYPDGLAGEAIPLMARIVAVADAFHAMISKRPYRHALSVSTALDEMRAGSGTQFDPQLVDALFAIAWPAGSRRTREARIAR